LNFIIYCSFQLVSN